VPRQIAPEPHVEFRSFAARVGGAVSTKRTAIEELVDGTPYHFGNREPLLFGVVSQRSELGLSERHQKPRLAAGGPVVLFKQILRRGTFLFGCPD
jgi:hypothetical protein